MLQFPPDEAEIVLLEEMEKHKQHGHNSRRLVVHIVAYPSDKQTRKANAQCNTHTCTYGVFVKHWLNATYLLGLDFKEQ